MFLGEVSGVLFSPFNRKSFNGVHGFLFQSRILQSVHIKAWVTTKMSQTTSQDRVTRSRAEISLEVTFATLVCLTSVIGNVLVVYVVNKYSEMQTITNILIRNLALTDIIMATLNMPFWITSLYAGKWNLSQEWCEVSATVHHTIVMASLLTMCLIALNRYKRQAILVY